jgi:hypothetical protein
MKSLIPMAAFAALFGGAVGGVVVHVGASAPTDDVTLGGATVHELESAVARLRDDNARLVERVTFLENQPVIAAPARESATAAIESAQSDPELDALVAALRNPDTPLPENFRAEIQSVYADIRAKEQKERDEERAKRDQERLARRVDEIAKELKLNPYQSTQLLETLAKEDLRREEMRDAMRDSGGDFRAMREEFDKLRAETKAEMARYLDNQQLATYDEKYSNPWGGRRGGGGRGPGGDAGPGSPAGGNGN